MAVVIFDSQSIRTRDSLNYICNYEKTVPDGGKIPLISGICCSPVFADTEFADTVSRSLSHFKIKGYSLRVVFEKSETDDPYEVHEIGRELAYGLFADRFESVVATHVNTASVHFHVLINAGSYSGPERLSMCIRKKDIVEKLGAICLARGIELRNNEIISGRDNALRWVELREAPTLRGLLKGAADLAVSLSRSADDFYGIMEDLGYSAERRNGKLYFYRQTEDRTLNPAKLGEEYTEAGILDRILSGREFSPETLPEQKKASTAAVRVPDGGNRIAHALGVVCASFSSFEDDPGKNVSILYNLGIMRVRKKALENALCLVSERGLESPEDMMRELERLREIRKKVRNSIYWKKPFMKNEDYDNGTRLRNDMEALEYVLEHLPSIENFAEDLEKGKFDRLEEKLREYGIGERVHGGHGDPSRE